MPNPPSPERNSRQFTLRSLFVFIALTALPLALAHYWLYGPDLFRLIVGLSAGIMAVVATFALLIVGPYIVIVGLAYLWNRRAAQPTFGGLVLRVVVISVVIYTMLYFLFPVPMARE